jgi:hypothetical protein
MICFPPKVGVVVTAMVFDTWGVEKIFYVLGSKIPSSHNNIDSLWCCNVAFFIIVVEIRKQDCKNTCSSFYIVWCCLQEACSKSTNLQFGKSFM